MLTLDQMNLTTGLRDLGCGVSNFAVIAGAGATRLSQGLSGAKVLENADRLLEILNEMRELQAEVDRLHGTHLPLDFSQIGAISHALVVRRIQRIMAEDGDHRLDAAAVGATKSIKSAAIGGQHDRPETTETTA